MSDPKELIATIISQIEEMIAGNAQAADHLSELDGMVQEFSGSDFDTNAAAHLSLATDGIDQAGRGLRGLLEEAGNHRTELARILGS